MMDKTMRWISGAVTLLVLAAGATGCAFSKNQSAQASSQAAADTNQAGSGTGAGGNHRGQFQSQEFAGITSSIQLTQDQLKNLRSSGTPANQQQDLTPFAKTTEDQAKTAAAQSAAGIQVESISLRLVNQNNLVYVATAKTADNKREFVVIDAGGGQVLKTVAMPAGNNPTAGQNNPRRNRSGSNNTGNNTGNNVSATS